MKIIVTGATGLIGAEVVRQAILDDDIKELILLVRSQPALQHPKITVVIHKDFLDYTTLANYFKEADAIAWCLGISQTQVSKKQYETITFGYLDACVNFCHAINPSLRFVFVSGDGADRTEQSKTIFKRIKGKAENVLLQSGLKNYFIIRPGAVRPKHKNKNAPLAYKLAYTLYPLLTKIIPDKIIWSDVVGKAILQVAKNGYEKDLLANLELKVIGEL